MPNGYDAVDDRRDVPAANRDMFIAGWVNQIVLSGVLVAGAWQLRQNSLLALLAAFMVALSVMAFIIQVHSDRRSHFTDALLLELGLKWRIRCYCLTVCSLSLYTSFDYLFGFTHCLHMRFHSTMDCARRVFQ